MGLSKLVLFGVCAALASSCAKDRNTDDYKRDQYQSDLAKVQSGAGTFTGYGTSKLTKTNLGAGQITFRSTTKPVNSNDQTKASAQPALVADIVFQGTTRMNVTIDQNTYFDDQSGAFSGTAVLTRADGKQESITLEGTIRNDGTFVGTLFANTYPQNGIDFVLKKNGPSTDALNKAQKPGDGAATAGQTSFSGTTTFRDGTTKPVNLVLLRPQTSSQDNFLSLLTPIKSLLSATLDFGQDATVAFTKTDWDEGNQILSGSTTIPGADKGDVTIFCNQGASRGLNCALRTGNSSEDVATIVLKPGTTTATDSPTNRDAITNVYNSSATVTKIDGSKVTTPIRLSVVYSARTRLAELYDLIFGASEQTLKATLTISPAKLPASISFQNAKWDKSSKTLDGDLLSSTGDASYNLYCANFEFKKRSYDFTCHLTGGVANTDVVVRFTSK